MSPWFKNYLIDKFINIHIHSFTWSHFLYFKGFWGKPTFTFKCQMIFPVWPALEMSLKQTILEVKSRFSLSFETIWAAPRDQVWFNTPEFIWSRHWYTHLPKIHRCVKSNFWSVKSVRLYCKCSLTWPFATVCFVFRYWSCIQVSGKTTVSVKDL